MPQRRTQTRRSLRPRKRLRAHREAIAWTGLDATAVRHRVPRQLSRQGRGMRATDAPVRSGATSGAKRRGASGEGRCRVRRPLRHPLAQDRRAWAEGCRQVAAKRRDCGKRVSVLHNPLLAVPDVRGQFVTICKTRFDGIGDVGRRSRARNGRNVGDAGKASHESVRMSPRWRLRPVGRTSQTVARRIASASLNNQEGERWVGVFIQRRRPDINQSKF